MDENPPIASDSPKAESRAQRDAIRSERRKKIFVYVFTVTVLACLFGRGGYILVETMLRLDPNTHSLNVFAIGLQAVRLFPADAVAAVSLAAGLLLFRQIFDENSPSDT